MAINKKLVNFKKKEDYTKQREEGNILDTSIVFIDDTKEIVTHNTVFNCNGGGETAVVNADWLAKEGEDGYIKNNPLVKMKETLGMINVYNATTNGNFSVSTYYFSLSESIKDGEKYIVTLDGVDYNVIAKLNPKSNYMSLTNGKIDDETGNPYILLEPQEGEFIISFPPPNYNTSGQFNIYDPTHSFQTTTHICEISKGGEGYVIDSKYITIPTVQTTGNSKTDVMSQKAVTDELDKKINNIKVNGFYPTVTNNVADLGNIVGGITVNGSNYSPDMYGNVNLGTIGGSDSPFVKGSGTNSTQMSGCTASGNYSVAEGSKTTASGESSHAEGFGTNANGMWSHSEGQGSTANGSTSHAEGGATIANGKWSHTEGCYTISQNNYEHASGIHNLSISGSTEFGDNGNTLFSVGNGYDLTKHNAFQIMQNGDIYIPDTNADGTYYEKPMIKLQDVIKQLKDKGLID